MSTGSKIPLTLAQAIASEWVQRLTPLCDRLEVAGSIRRRRPEVGDVEICAMPRLALAHDLQALVGADFRAYLSADESRQLRDLGTSRGMAEKRNAWIKAKALEVAQRRQAPVRFKGEFPGKHMQLALVQGTCLDLFLCDVETWGVNFLIRTGSADYSHAVMAHANDVGHTSKEARLYRRGKGGDPTGSPLQTREEGEVFAALGIPWMQPEDRTGASALAIRLKAEGQSPGAALRAAVEKEQQLAAGGY